MYWIILIAFIIIMAVGLFLFKVKSLINSYAQYASQNDLFEIGVSAKNFIGLHIKALASDHLNPKLIYVRKTTPYKGLILFIPDWKFDYHFYLPFFYLLCRKGYLIVTYTSEKEIYSQTPDEIDALIKCIKADEVLKTYPLSVLGHGSGGFTALYSENKWPEPVKIVTLAALPAEAEALLNYVQKNMPFSVNFFRKMILFFSHRRYHCSLNRALPDIHHPTLFIQGQDDPLAQHFYTNWENESVTMACIEKKLHHPYLNLISDLRLDRLTEQLKSPETSQFDYNKILETFDTDMLYDLDLEVAEKIDRFIAS